MTEHGSRRSTALTSDQKRLYRKYLELDRPKGYKTGGCFAKIATIARRLGVAPGSVKRNQRALQTYGLLARTPEGVTPIRWFPTLPPWVTCVRPDTVARGKATDAWIMAQAAELDRVLPIQMSEAKAAKRAARSDSKSPDQICTPESADLYPEGTQIVPPEGSNCTPVLPRPALPERRNEIAA
jgi:hypothetical protein